MNKMQWKARQLFWPIVQTAKCSKFNNNQMSEKQIIHEMFVWKLKNFSSK